MKVFSQYINGKWEYLPSFILHFPTAFIYLFFSLKSRSFLFFTNISNDYKSSDIENSSKNYVYQKLNENFYPKTVLVRRNSIQNLQGLQLEEQGGLRFPIIVKPNIGKRGLGAKLISNDEELSQYYDRADYDFLIQEYVDSLRECGIFYIKNPLNQRAEISSIGMKTLPTITGDGCSNLRELLDKNQTPADKIERMADRFNLEDTILEKDENLIIEPIGAHNRGAKIKAANHLISPELLQIIEHSLSGLDLYYGRLDIKYDTWEDLLNGDFKIIEVNTITSEPLSIYDRSISIVKKYKIIYVHLKSMYEISSYLKKSGEPVLNVKTFIDYILNYRAHLKRISAPRI